MLRSRQSKARPLLPVAQVRPPRGRQPRLPVERHLKSGRCHRGRSPALTSSGRLRSLRRRHLAKVQPAPQRASRRGANIRQCLQKIGDMIPMVRLVPLVAGGGVKGRRRERQVPRLRGQRKRRPATPRGKVAVPARSALLRVLRQELPLPDQRCSRKRCRATLTRHPPAPLLPRERHLQCRTLSRQSLRLLPRKIPLAVGSWPQRWRK